MMSQRDIVLIPFPFSDQTRTKVRPALVLSKEVFNSQSQDVIVCGMTSKLSKDFYSIQIGENDLEKGLVEMSMVKVESLAKVEQRLILKTIGRLKPAKFEQVLEKIDSLFRG